MPLLSPFRLKKPVKPIKVAKPKKEFYGPELLKRLELLLQRGVSIQNNLFDSLSNNKAEPLTHADNEQLIRIVYALKRLIERHH